MYQITQIKYTKFRITIQQVGLQKKIRSLVLVPQVVWTAVLNRNVKVERPTFTSNRFPLVALLCWKWTPQSVDSSLFISLSLSLKYKQSDKVKDDLKTFNISNPLKRFSSKLFCRKRRIYYYILLSVS